MSLRVSNQPRSAEPRWSWRGPELFPPLIGLGAAAVLLRSLFLPISLGPTLTGFVDDWLFNIVQLAAGLVVVALGYRHGSEKRAWQSIGAGMVLWCLGNVWWSVFLGSQTVVTTPSVPDVLWLSSYPLLGLGVVKLLQARSGGELPLSVFFDASIAGSSVLAVGCATVLKSVLSGQGESSSSFFYGVIYPVLDTAVLGLMIGMAFVVGWHTIRSLSPLIVGLLLFVVADVSYYLRTLSPNADNRGWEALWTVALALMAFAPLTKRTTQGRGDVRASAIVAVLSGSTSLGILLLGNYTKLVETAVLSATLTMVLVIMRVAVSFHHHQELISAQYKLAHTDPLTEVFNRRKFTYDSAKLTHDGTPASLVLLDLDGFKQFNDCFGHIAGDELLRGVARILHEMLAMNGQGSVYRFGGDEFCVVVTNTDLYASGALDARMKEILLRCQREAIAFSYGVVLLEPQTRSLTESLAFCDSLLYQQKRSHKTAKNPNVVLHVSV
jgi:diguanylate cyclase (GGDEF)-like protein